MATLDAKLTPIDHWLRDSLADRYTSVLREELPREWLRLLAEASDE